MASQGAASLHSRTAVAFSSVALLASLVTAPLVRSLPEVASILTFVVLFPLTFVLTMVGCGLGFAVVRESRERRRIVALLLAVAALVVFVVSFFTPLLWPYHGF